MLIGLVMKENKLQGQQKTNKQKGRDTDSLICIAQRQQTKARQNGTTLSD